MKYIFLGNGKTGENLGFSEYISEWFFQTKMQNFVLILINEPVMYVKICHKCAFQANNFCGCESDWKIPI